jgi:CheY-like chemotaxis protein
MTRILLIDDDVLARDMLRQILEHAGYEVVDAASGREGLQHYQATAIDLIITDILMPDQDGLSRLQKVLSYI